VAGEVEAQGVGQAQGHYPARELGDVADRGVGEGLLDHVDAGDAHVLFLFGGKALVLDDAQRLADGRQRGADTLEEVDRAHPGDVGFVQVAGPGRAFVEVGLDLVGRRRPGVERIVAGKQGVAQRLVGGQRGDHGLRATVEVGRQRADGEENFPQIEAAIGPVEVADVLEDVVHGAVDDGAAGGGAAAFGHVVHHL